MDLEAMIATLPKPYGQIDSGYFEELINVIQFAQYTYPRLTAIRVDLHYPTSLLNNDMPCMVLVDHGDKITRFFKSLRAKLSALSARKHKAGLRIYSHDMHYVWAREQCTSESPHYHILLLLNKDAFYHLGDYTNPDSLAGLIIQAWASVWGLHTRMPGYGENLALFAKVVHFPTNGVYYLNVSSPAARYERDWMELVKRAGYLTKVATKDIQSGWHSFGSSLTTRNRKRV